MGDTARVAAVATPDDVGVRASLGHNDQVPWPDARVDELLAADGEDRAVARLRVVGLNAVGDEGAPSRAQPGRDEAHAFRTGVEANGRAQRRQYLPAAIGRDAVDVTPDLVGRDEVAAEA